MTQKMHEPEELALDRARRELAEASVALGEIRRAATLDALEAAWTKYLMHLDTAWNKIDVALKSAQGAAGAWVGTIRAARKNDPLLRYLHQAKNADQHGIVPVITEHRRVTGLGRAGPGPGFVESFQVDGMGRVVELRGTNIRATQSSTVSLAAVTSRNVTTDPPMVHLDRPLSDRSAHGVATLGLAYYRARIEEAAQWLTPKSGT